MKSIRNREDARKKLRRARVWGRKRRSFPAERSLRRSHQEPESPRQLQGPLSSWFGVGDLNYGEESQEMSLKGAPGQSSGTTHLNPSRQCGNLLGLNDGVRRE